MSLKCNEDIVVLCGGGTGGHLFPAIATAEELIKNNINPWIFTDMRCSKYLNPEDDFNTEIFHIRRPKSGLLYRILFLLSLAYNTILCLKKFWQLKPKMMVSYGGYPTMPMLIAANIIKLPYVIYESNSILGRTNKFFGKNAKFITTAFQTTKGIAPDLNEKIIHVGFIVRNKIAQIKYNPKASMKNINICAFGGSQGAGFFDKNIPDALEKIAEKYPKLLINITQQSSTSEIKSIENRYKKLKINYDISEFFYDIGSIYQNSDIVICRAGASTIGEMVTSAIPAIYIPLPSASDNHQYHNAKLLAENEQGWYLLQNDDMISNLSNLIDEILQQPDILILKSKRLKEMKSDGVRLLNSIIINK